MKLYGQPKEVIYDIQNKDPFFWYLTRKIFSYIDASRGGVVLDLGCGSGRNTFYAAQLGFRAIGIDCIQKAVDNGNSHAKAEGVNGRVKFVKADITRLKSRQFGTVDYVILNEVIEHIDNYQKIIDFAFDSLRPGGKILLTTPHDPAQWTVMDDYAQHVRRFTLEEISIALSKFSNVSIKTVGFPLHRLSIKCYNLIKKIQGRSHEPKTFRSSPFVSQLYYIVGTIVMNFDNIWDSKMGTTIVAVGTK